MTLVNPLSKSAIDQQIEACHAAQLEPLPPA